MNSYLLDPKIAEGVNNWLDGDFDEETKDQVRYMIEKEPENLSEAFYRDLEFGTGGLRGIMGVGTNRMNKYTVGMATQGLSNYLKKMFAGRLHISVSIAHDSRNNSRYFASIAANVLSSNGIRVFLFDDLRPTPELSFSIRYLKCQSGIVITASHNPKEYNGYKVYWEDGAQLISPHDDNVIEEVQKIKSISEKQFAGKPELIETIGPAIDKAYLDMIKNQSLSPESILQQKNLKIVYTPLHGSGTMLVPAGLRAVGFENINVVKEQEMPDGNFPTIKSPNPEEAAALSMAIDYARALDADLILATDPDADRLGVGVKDPKDNILLLNGNQTATLITWYLLHQWHDKGKLTGTEFMVKTIVTTELLQDIAHKYKVEMFDVLTGFKFIAGIIRDLEGKRKFIGGGEESYGYLVGDDVRDKDAVASSCMIAEAAAWAACQGKNLFGLLLDIYIEYGLYKESLVNVTRKGKDGEEEIKRMMDEYRNHPMREINGVKLILIKDYLLQLEKDLVTGTERPIRLPKSNVLQFFLEDGSKITVRPSGTEPKIKFYFGVKAPLESREDYSRVDAVLGQKLEAIVTAMAL